ERSASITVPCFKGIGTSGTNGSGAIGAAASVSAPTGAPAASVTTTRNGSLVLGVGNDWDGATARTLGANQVMVHQYFGTYGDTFWVQRLASAVPTNGTTAVINDTAPTDHQWNLSLVEVRAPAPSE